MTLWLLLLLVVLVLVLLPADVEAGFRFKAFITLIVLLCAFSIVSVFLLIFLPPNALKNGFHSQDQYFMIELFGFIGTVVLSGVLGLAAAGLGGVRSGILAGLLFMGIWAGASFGTQRALMERNYNHQCRQLGYDTRMTVNSKTLQSELHFYNSGVSLRAFRTYARDELTIPSMTFSLERPAGPSNLTQVQVRLSLDGLNTSVTGQYGANVREIGTVEFRKRRPAHFKLQMGPERPQLRTWFAVNLNPNKILDGDGVELARILPKFWDNPRHLAICGREKHLELSLFLGAITQQFQSYNRHCKCRKYYIGNVLYEDCQNSCPGLLP